MKKVRALRHYDAGKGVVAAGAVHDVHPDQVSQLLAEKLIEVLPEEPEPVKEDPVSPPPFVDLSPKEAKRSKNKKG